MAKNKNIGEIVIYKPKGDKVRLFEGIGALTI